MGDVQMSCQYNRLCVWSVWTYVLCHLGFDFSCVNHCFKLVDLSSARLVGTLCMFF